jgi:hypothetical protein
MPTLLVTTMQPTIIPSIELTTLTPTIEATTLTHTEVKETDSPTVSPTVQITTADTTNSPTKLEFPTMAPTGPKEETNAPSTMSPTVAETGSPTQSPTVALTTSRPSVAVTESIAGPLSIELQYDYNSECGVTADDIINGLNDLTLKKGLALATETVVIGVLNSTYPIAGGSTLAPIGKSTPAPSTSPVSAGSTYRPRPMPM